MARPWVAGVVALVAYLLRASLSPNRLRHTNYAYYNYLADAFLHGQLNLRFTTAYDRDLIYYAERIYLYWPPFPAIILMPLVGLFGVGLSDVLFTVVCGAIAIALVAKLLATLEQTGVAP